MSFDHVVVDMCSITVSYVILTQIWQYSLHVFPFDYCKKLRLNYLVERA